MCSPSLRVGLGARGCRLGVCCPSIRRAPLCRLPGGAPHEGRSRRDCRTRCHLGRHGPANEHPSPALLPLATPGSPQSSTARLPVSQAIAPTLISLPASILHPVSPGRAATL